MTTDGQSIYFRYMKKTPQELNWAHESVLDVTGAIINTEDVIKATKYISPNLIVRAVRKTYKSSGKKPDMRMNIEMTLTVGKPNYVEREFVALCKKAKEPFPVKKIQLKLWKKK